MRSYPPIRPIPLGSFAGLACALLVMSLAAPVQAQSVTVDEGVFLVSMDGEPAGTESFSIRRSGSGDDAQVIATAEIQLDLPEGRTDLRPSLHAVGRDMDVYAYQIKVSGAQQEELTVREGDSRYITRVRSERGEREREFRAAPGTLLLDSDVAHQFHFLSARLETGGSTIPVISPREGRQYELTASEIGTESISIGSSSVQARHVRLEGEGGARDVWMDTEGRVLRVLHESRGYEAVREALP